MSKLFRFFVMVFILSSSACARGKSSIGIEVDALNLSNGSLDLHYSIFNGSTSTVEVSPKLVCPAIKLMSADIFEVTKIVDNGHEKLDFIGGHFYPVEKQNAFKINSHEGIECSYPLSIMYDFKIPFKGSYTIKVKDSILSFTNDNIEFSTINFQISNGSITMK
jgi:hypothetical protein